MNKQDPRQRQLEWYQRNGKYPDRIVLDSQGKPYVIGDWAWNILHPKKFEVIERRAATGEGEGE